MPPTDLVSFADLDLDPALHEAVAALGFETATPIQAAAIPLMLADRDVVGRARTGSGKTAAFGLPMLERVKDGQLENAPRPRALVLAPTRELALQVTEALRSFARRLPIRIATIYGGAPYPPQISALRTATVIVGTPGRLLDHLDRGTMDLSGVERVVLDEADEMLRMGFVDDVQTLLAATPKGRTVALFSATMPPAIRRIADEHLTDPVEVQVEGQAMTVDHINQRWIRVPQRNKLEALIRLLHVVEADAVLVFVRTKLGCAEVADALAQRGLSVDALHGDLSQSARERVVKRLRSRRLNVVIATDVAARGLDVDHITHVVNLDLPIDVEVYVHRIGRTGRGGRPGTAISLVTPKEKRRVREFARRLDTEIEMYEVPTDAEIARAQRRALGRTLTDALAEDHAPAVAWLEEFMDDGEHDLATIAAAAVHLLAQRDGHPLTDSPEEAPPSWTRPPRHTREERQGRGAANEVHLFLPVGRRRNVRPADVVGALASEADIDGSQIGRVDIQDRKTFVGLPREVANTILGRLTHVQIRGNQVPITLARPGSPGRGGGPPRHSGRV